jgi:hypothetical protein
VSIDLSKLVAPGESTTPFGPTTSLTVPSSNLDPTGGVPAGPEPGSQAAIDAMSPWDRAGRGLDVMGAALFGQGNGSWLGGVPIVGDAGRALKPVGDLIHGAGDLSLIKPFEIGGNALSHVPLGWLPGGADENFNMFGDYMKANDPEAYQTWLAVKANSDADFLGGGNMKADFNMRAAEFYDDQTKNGVLGSNPILGMGRAGVGSLGGGLSHAIQGWLGLAGGEAQGFLGHAGVFNPDRGTPTTIQKAIADKQAVGQTTDAAEYAIKQFQSGAFSEQQANDYLASSGQGSRVVESLARIERGGEANDVERKAAEAFKTGEWTEEHANDYIVSHGSSITRNPIGQIAGSVLTDPLTYATIGAGSIAKAGKVGADVLEGGVGAASKYEKLGVLVR